MNQEWQQKDFILESCPINGYRISLIPSKFKNIINSRSNIYSKIEEPKLFPNEKTLNNNGFYLSSFGKLKPKVTIKNASNISNNNFKIYNRGNYINRNILNNYNKSEDNYYYNRNKGRQILRKRIIKIFNNDMPFIMRTEPEEESENIYKYKKNKNYYLTPNYYNSQDDDDDSYLDNKNDYIIGNINYPVIYKFNDNANIKHTRKNTDNDNLLSKRRIKNGYKYKKYNETEYKDIRRINENKNKIFSNLNSNIYNRYKKINPINDNKRYVNQGKNYSLLNKKFNHNGERKVKNNSKEMNNTVTVTTTNLNNHTFFISNNKENNLNSVVKITPSHKNSNNINKYTLENLQNEKSLNNKISYYKERNHTYNENDIINKNDYYIKLKRRDLNENEIPKRKIGKIEHYIDKYYDKQGNFIGTKNIIITKKYGNNGEKIVKEIIREEINSDYKNLFKKDKFIQENQKRNIEIENNSNKDEINKNDNIYNNVEEEKNRFTFENKSNVLKFELEDKEEKEADEQKILFNSEFEDEEKEKAEEEENNKEINNNILEQNNEENEAFEDKNENNEIKEDKIKNNDDENKEQNKEDNKEQINNLKNELLIESKINNEMNNNEENHINN